MFRDRKQLIMISFSILYYFDKISQIFLICCVISRYTGGEPKRREGEMLYPVLWENGVRIPRKRNKKKTISLRLNRTKAYYTNELDTIFGIRFMFLFFFMWLKCFLR